MEAGGVHPLEPEHVNLVVSGLGHVHIVGKGAIAGLTTVEFAHSLAADFGVQTIVGQKSIV